MIANIHNENFGYSVACEGNWSTVGNPALLRYTAASASMIKTGSVEVYRYNVHSDTHDLITTLKRPPYAEEDIYLIVESGSAEILHTEATGSLPYTSDLDILIDLGLYYTASDDAYGRSLDLHNNILVVGNPYYSSSANFPISGSSTPTFRFSGSGNVDLFDLTRLNSDQYAPLLTPSIIGYGISSSLVAVEVNVPANQRFGYILLESTPTGSTSYTKTSIALTSNNGGSVVLYTNFSNSGSVNFRVSGIVSNDPYVTTIPNPNTAVSNSFGWDVSRNDVWLAVSSIYESGSKGAVFMYKKVGTNESSWSLYQTILPPGDISSGNYFGWSIDLNKATGSYSGSMVIGSNKGTGSSAYVYALVNGAWTQSAILVPSSVVAQPLTFFPTIPYFSGSLINAADSFGYDVAIYADTVVVGAPTDRFIYEYTGSSLYHQGAVYFFQQCAEGSNRYYLARKSYGNEKILKDNALGWSVSVNGDYAVVGSPKYYMNPSICYLRGSLYQQHYCGDPDEAINGQFVLYNKASGSIPNTTNVDWDITNVYQIKKRLLQPHRAYGFAVDICDNFITVGSPMLISDSNRIMDLSPSTGSFTGSVSDLGDLSGKAYIYNLNNLREQFYVGNVFYRNGKMVVMTSGSSFEGILQNNTDENFEYEMDFKSKQVVFEKQIVCPVDIGEFNVSTNPTSLTIVPSPYDLNQNGQFDFQDVDVLLRYMKFKSTETDLNPSTDWSSSIISINTDEEITVYNANYANWTLTDSLYTQSYYEINNTLLTELDFNQDNKIDSNDMNILWKYFIYRLTQQNYETYVTPNSTRKYLSDIIDYLNGRTMRGQPPLISSGFADYATLSKADPTGSYLAPYVTAVGLYSGCDLVAVAKLGSPIKITPDFPINFVVKMDF